MSNQDLRAALEAASTGNSYPLGNGAALSPRFSTINSPAEFPGTMIVERLPIFRVDVKTEVASFVEQHFLSRTHQDGTILALSKESLIEELTTLFCGLEERASQIEHSQGGNETVKRKHSQSKPEHKSTQD